MLTAPILILALLIIGCNTTKRHRSMSKSGADSSTEKVEKSAEKTVLESSSNTQIETTNINTDLKADDSNVEITFNENGGSIVITTDTDGVKTISALNVKGVKHKQVKSTVRKDTSFIKTNTLASHKVDSEKEQDSKEKVQTKSASKVVSNILQRTKTPWYFWLGIPLLLILIVGAIAYIKRKGNNLII